MAAPTSHCVLVLDSESFTSESPPPAATLVKPRGTRYAASCSLQLSRSRASNKPNKSPRNLPPECPHCPRLSIILVCACTTLEKNGVANIHCVQIGVTEDELGSSASADLDAWLFFQLAADHVFLPILVATFVFSRSVVRHSTLINLCCTWILSGIISSLL